jgi:hypothetical protein
MIIWKGAGLLAIVIPCAIGFVFLYLFQRFDAENTRLWWALSNLISGCAVWILGKRLNTAKKIVHSDYLTAKEQFDISTKENHSLFFIPMQFWGILIGLGGIYNFVVFLFEL